MAAPFCFAVILSTTSRQFARTRARQLERQLQSKLNDARPTRLRDLAKSVGKSERTVRISRQQELSMVKRVEKFRAELELCALVEFEVLEHGKIDVVDPWAANGVT